MSQPRSRKVATLVVSTDASFRITVNPVTALQVPDPANCSVPDSLLPLFELLNALTQLAFLGGVGLGVLGFSTAGLFFMLPGEDNNRRGKLAAKNVLLGVIILLSANMVVGFLVNELGGVVCS